MSWAGTLGDKLELPCASKWYEAEIRPHNQGNFPLFFFLTFSYHLTLVLQQLMQSQVFFSSAYLLLLVLDCTRVRILFFFFLRFYWIKLITSILIAQQVLGWSFPVSILVPPSTIYDLEIWKNIPSFDWSLISLPDCFPNLYFCQT